MFMNVWMIIWPLQKKIIAATVAAAAGNARSGGAAALGPSRVSRVADEHVAVDPDAVLHGCREPLPIFNTLVK